MAVEKPNLDELAPTEQSFEELRLLMRDKMEPFGEDLYWIEKRIKTFKTGQELHIDWKKIREEPIISINVEVPTGKQRITLASFTLAPEGLLDLRFLPTISLGETTISHPEEISLKGREIKDDEERRLFGESAKEIVDWVRKNIDSEEYLPPPISLFPKGFVKNPENPELQASS